MLNNKLKPDILIGGHMKNDEKSLQMNFFDRVVHTKNEGKLQKMSLFHREDSLILI